MVVYHDALEMLPRLFADAVAGLGVKAPAARVHKIIWGVGGIDRVEFAAAGAGKVLRHEVRYTVKEAHVFARVWLFEL